MGHRTTFGLDVHARSVTATALDTLTGEVVTRRFCGEVSQLAEWILSFEGPVKAVYESGVMGFHLARVLRDEYSIDCVVGAVSKMFKPATDKKKKTDARDSVFLARMLAANNIVEVYIPDEECESMRNLIRAYDDAKSELKAATSRLSQFLIRRGHIWNERTATGNLKCAWKSTAYVAWLNSLSFSHPADQVAFDHYLGDAYILDAHATELKRQISLSSAHPRYGHIIDALCSIKGIDTITSFALAVEVDDFSRFPTHTRFASWLGLTSGEYSSGDKQVRGSITKTGNSLLRRLLTECAWSYARIGSARKALKEGSYVSEAITLKAHLASLRLIKRRRHLKACGKHVCVVNVAIARELACWIWEIARMAEDEVATMSAAKVS